MPDLRTIDAEEHDARRAWRLLLAALLLAAFTLPALPAGAAARSLHLKITTPRAGATVTPTFDVRARVRAHRGRVRVRCYIDGRQVSSRSVGRGSASSLGTSVVAPSPGRHRLRVLVSRGHRRTSRSVTVSVLEPGAGLPDPPPANERFRAIFSEGFSVPAARGSLGSEHDADKIVYTGAYGTNWVTYPRSYLDTYDKRPYRSDRVLSVHDGYLDYHLHHVDGRPAGANLSPLLARGSQYQTYGRYSARMRVVGGDLSEYHIAWLLWPERQDDWQRAESDFPEGPLKSGNNGVFAYHHWSDDRFEWFGDPATDIHEWHTYTQDWTPTERRYWIDDRLVGVTGQPVYHGPERWQLQIETKGDGGGNGHVLVDWAAVWSL
jgi:hypothetical protein